MLSRELNRPPRIALITETAWKSGIRRGRPRWPTRISVWTEPGRWITRTSRPTDVPVSSIAPPSFDALPAPDPTHDPKRRSAIAVDVEPGEVAADHERRALRPERRARRSRGGPRPSAVRRCRASRRTAGGTAPRRRRSSRRRPPRRAGGGPPGPAGGRSAARRGGARPRTPGSVGSRRTSATSSSAGSRRLAGTSTPTVSASQPASAWSEAPSRSAASISAIASCRAVPSVSARAARTVAPPSSAGSSTEPPVRISDAETSGRPGRSATTSDSPLERVRPVTAGNS